ncbi:sensor histidine kinase [Natrialbaceae archaeon AArc-T1-2]|uniref:sensor histidine kinase n=1 Tax=Natrialbaceae archaeon AArc-T1-2 TaxID=3053904 RepID=UPI00255ACA0C|nr:ATP-binding protein [Natrialbaceae archaeon AArc-T1-2]WIV66272.1 ATP-binding protein [Natrialbaceae archaeon AArc-T1-2]
MLAVGRAFAQLSQGEPAGNVFVVTLLVVVPGGILVGSGYWLSRSGVAHRFYPDVASWCLGGFGAMTTVLVVYHLQPEGGVSDPATSVPILTALSSAAGFAVGVHDGKAKTRTHQLEQRNRELHDTQETLEDAVDRLERYKLYTDEVLDAVTDVFYVLEADGTLQRWNESLVEVTGYTDAEIESMSAMGFFDEDERDRIEDVIAEGFETGHIQIEAELFTKDGEYVPYEFVASTLDNPAGETVLAGVGRDVSGRKQRERHLRRRARQQQVVADLGQLALETDDLDELMHDATRQVADVLDAEHCKVLDLEAGSDDLLLRHGVGWADGLVGEETVSAVEADSQAAYTLANDRPIVVEDLETETRFDGPELLTSHDVRSGISIVVGPFDEPWGILGVHDTARRTFTDQDVTFVQSVANILAETIERYQYQTELEQLVADLEESNERLEQFAYAASHDLQEPLRMVSSYLQLIERRYEDELDEDGTEFLSFAVDGADRMRSMIDGLLEYSRVETEGDPLEPVDLEAVLEDVRDDLQVKIDETDATITAASLPRVSGDPNQLRQLFQNLFENAIEYSGDDPPRIHVSATRNGTEWTVSVRDEGIGIDSDDQDRVFELFHRAHSRHESSGTGIGLALCQRIVERHGGTIRVDSEPGEGTTFSFALPAIGEHNERPRRARSG